MKLLKNVKKLIYCLLAVTLLIPAFGVNTYAFGKTKPAGGEVPEEAIYIAYGESISLENGNEISYESSDIKIACISDEGILRTMGIGLCIITVTNGETLETNTFPVRVYLRWWRVFSNIAHFIRNLNCPVCKGKAPEPSPSEPETTLPITTEPITEPVTEPTSEPLTEPEAPKSLKYEIPKTIEGANATIPDDIFDKGIIDELDGLFGYLVFLPLSSIDELISFKFDGIYMTSDNLTEDEQLDTDLYCRNLEDYPNTFVFIYYNDEPYVLLLVYYDEAGNIAPQNVTEIEYLPKPVETTTETTTESTTESTTTSTTTSTTESTTQSTTESTTESTTTSTTKYMGPDVESTTKEEKVLLNKLSSFGGSFDESVTGADGRADYFYVCGNSSSRDGNFIGLVQAGSYTPYGYIQRYNKDGNLLFTKVMARTDASVYFTDVCALRNGNAAVCGYTYVDSNRVTKATPFVAEYDTNGKQLWVKYINGSLNDFFYCISATSNGFVVGGRAASSDKDFSGILNEGAAVAVFIRFQITVNSSTGAHSPEILWQRYLSGDSHAKVSDVSVDQNNNIFLSVSTASTKYNFADFSGLLEGNTDNIILKYDYKGDLQWYYTLSTICNDCFDVVTADGEGGCIAGGYYQHNGAAFGQSIGGTLSDVTFMGGVDSLVVKLNSTGQKVWQRRISGMRDDYISDIVKNGNSYIIGGYSSSDSGEFTLNYGGRDGFLDVISATGNKVGIYSLGGMEDDGVTALAVTNSNLLALGVSLSDDEYFDGQNIYADASSQYYDCFAAKYTLK